MCSVTMCPSSMLQVPHFLVFFFLSFHNSAHLVSVQHTKSWENTFVVTWQTMKMFRSTLLLVYNNILLLLVRISRLLHYFGSSARHFLSGPVVWLCFDCTSCARRFEWQLHITFPFFFFMGTPGTHHSLIDVKPYKSEGCNIRCVNDTLLVN